MTNHSPDLWVLTCAPGSRKEEAEFLFTMLGTPVERRVVVTTEPDPIKSISAHLLRFPYTEINISKWWTLGLDAISSQYEAGEQWDVLIAETDVRISPQDVDTIRRVMRESDCVLAGADWKHLTNGKHKIRRNQDEWKPLSRLPGFALITAGEKQLRHDPQFRWWLADDDLEWSARANGGTVLVSGTTLYHDGTQGPLTGDRLTAFEEDLPRFEKKWGKVPTEG